MNHYKYMTDTGYPCFVTQAVSLKHARAVIEDQGYNVKPATGKLVRLLEIDHALEIGYTVLVAYDLEY